MGERGKGNTLKLSPRQREIANLIADGKDAAAIAEMLGLNIRTVHNHLNAARRKKNAKTTLELAAYIRMKRKSVYMYTGSTT